jgi:hypothetical protein
MDSGDGRSGSGTTEAAHTSFLRRIQKGLEDDAIRELTNGCDIFAKRSIILSLPVSTVHNDEGYKTWRRELTDEHVQRVHDAYRIDFGGLLSQTLLLDVRRDNIGFIEFLLTLGERFVIDDYISIVQDIVHNISTLPGPIHRTPFQSDRIFKILCVVFKLVLSRTYYTEGHSFTGVIDQCIRMMCSSTVIVACREPYQYQGSTVTPPMQCLFTDYFLGLPPHLLITALSALKRHTDDIAECLCLRLQYHIQRCQSELMLPSNEHIQAEYRAYFKRLILSLPADNIGAAVGQLCDYCWWHPALLFPIWGIMVITGHLIVNITTDTTHNTSKYARDLVNAASKFNILRPTVEQLARECGIKHILDSTALLNSAAAATVSSSHGADSLAEIYDVERWRVFAEVLVSSSNPSCASGGDVIKFIASFYQTDSRNDEYGHCSFSRISPSCSCSHKTIRTLNEGKEGEVAYIQQSCKGSRMIALLVSAFLATLDIVFDEV